MNAFRASTSCSNGSGNGSGARAVTLRRSLGGRSGGVAMGRVTHHHKVAMMIKPSASASSSRATSPDHDAGVLRRDFMQKGALSLGVSIAMATVKQGPALAVGSSEEPTKMLCDARCLAGLESAQMVTTPSGLQYKDIKVGRGVEPPKGFQVVCQYVALIEENGKTRIFESTMERKEPANIRVGAGQVIPGLDEGLSTMKVGGVRRLYVPGNLSFPKGLAAAPGRARVPPASPIIMDVFLLDVPGFDLPDEEEEVVPAPAPAEEAAPAPEAAAEVVA